MSGMAEAIEFARRGATDRAIEGFRQVLNKEPENGEARFWLSMMLRKKGDLEEARDHAQRLATQTPNETLIRSNFALILRELGRHEDAAQQFQAAIELKPEATNNYLPLAKCLHQLNRDKEAVHWLQKAREWLPGDTALRVALAQSLLAIGDAKNAKKEAERIRPPTDESELLLAGALIELGESEQALPHLQRLKSSKDPSVRAYALTSLGLAQAAAGQSGEEAFQESIEVLPKQGFAYLSLVRSRRVDESCLAILQEMEALAQDPTLTPRDQSMLHYGLGKAREDLGDYDKAIEHFHEANAITKRLKVATFSAADYHKGIDRLIELFPKEIYQTNPDQASTKPIFVLGMMRSGTTLVEQILSSHSQVEPGGEKPFWMEALEPCRGADGRIDRSKVEVKAAEYLATIDKAKHTTDKMPANYLRVGLIHLALPNAKMVHVKRNARDNCVSIYTTPSSAVHPWLNDPANIAAAYAEYLRLMRYWEQTIPQDRLFTIEYENLVLDPEPQIRRLLDFCGLNWEDACLSPEKNSRSVLTPSLWQVRQPIYTGSLRRWDRYCGKLREFEQLPDK